MGDAVMTVLRVSSQVPIEPVSHVDQFFGDHDFERSRARTVDPGQINEDHMLVGMRPVRVCAGNR
jgi:hypothetical protein